MSHALESTCRVLSKVTPLIVVATTTTRLKQTQFEYLKAD